MTDVIAGMGTVPIGRQGENLVTRVVLPNIRGGAGGIVLLHQRSRDKNPYPVTVTEDAGHVYWVVSSADTAYDGMGRLELQWQGSGGEVLKSKIWQTYCQRSLTKPADPPEPWADYIGDVARNAAVASSAAKKTAEMYDEIVQGLEDGSFKGDKGDPGEKGEPGEKGDPGAAATIRIGTVTTGAAGSNASVSNGGTASAAVLNFTIPRGSKGDKGDPGAGADWNQNDPNGAGYVANRPGGHKAPTGFAIDFDGNTDGLPTKLMYDSIWYKISDENPYPEQFIDCDCTVDGETTSTDIYYEDDGTYSVAINALTTTITIVVDAGIWATVFDEDIPLPPITVSQTYTGYIPIPADLIGSGIPHSKLLSLGAYDVEVPAIQSVNDSKFKELEKNIKSGDYKYANFNTSAGSMVGIALSENSYVTAGAKPNGSGGYYQFFEVVGGFHVAYWKTGDSYATIFERYVPYYAPGKNLRLKSSTSGSKKIFEITVDDTGTISATEVTA